MNLRGKWRAQVYIDKKQVTIGYFNTLEEAKQARQDKERNCMAILFIDVK